MQRSKTCTTVFHHFPLTLFSKAIHFFQPDILNIPCSDDVSHLRHISTSHQCTPPFQEEVIHKNISLVSKPLLGKLHYSSSSCLALPFPRLLSCPPRSDPYSHYNSSKYNFSSGEQINSQAGQYYSLYRSQLTLDLLPLHLTYQIGITGILYHTRNQAMSQIIF